MIWLETFIITFIVSAIYELLALNTPFNIFGSKYNYNLKQPFFKYSFLGFPLIMPFLWATCKTVIPQYLGFIWFDLMLDPLAQKLGWWKWKRKGLWFGVPLTNYFGWTIVWLTVEVIKNAKIF